jgi:glutathione S-transferase
MTLTLYGSHRSRAKRTLWTLAELNVPFTHVALEWDDPLLKTAEFLRLNPAGAIPILVDGEVAIAESLAINLHLARAYSTEAAPLQPRTSEGQAHAWRWTLWAQGHLEPWVQTDRASQAVRGVAPEAVGAVIAEGLATLERALVEREWLVEGRFTVADLNVAAVLSPSRPRRLDLTATPRVEDWLTRCYDRPAARRMRERFPD